MSIFKVKTIYADFVANSQGDAVMLRLKKLIFELYLLTKEKLFCPHCGADIGGSTRVQVIKKSRNETKLTVIEGGKSGLDCED